MLGMHRCGLERKPRPDAPITWLGDWGATLWVNVVGAIPKDGCTGWVNQGAAFGSPDMWYTSKEYEKYPG